MYCLFYHYTCSSNPVVKPIDCLPHAESNFHLLLLLIPMRHRGSIALPIDNSCIDLLVKFQHCSTYSCRFFRTEDYLSTGRTKVSLDIRNDGRFMFVCIGQIASISDQFCDRTSGTFHIYNSVKETINLIQRTKLLNPDSH